MNPPYCQVHAILPEPPWPPLQGKCHITLQNVNMTNYMHLHANDSTLILQQKAAKFKLYFHGNLSTVSVQCLTSPW